MAGPCGRADDLPAGVSARLDALARQAEAGDAAAAAALAEAGSDGRDAAARMAALWSEADAGAGLYEVARKLDAAGRLDDASLVLAALAGDPEGRPAGLLGLAVLALRAGRLDAAAALVGPCLRAEDRHPRACSVAGVVELERGNVPAAQGLLAAASRVARAQPAYRVEMQIAQRALLLMHLR